MSIKLTNISGLILAGGQGARVQGKDKGWLKYQGVHLITHQIKWLTDQVEQVIISANRNINDYKKLGHEVVTDDSAGYSGPLQGIKCGLEACSTDWLFVQPVDMPNLPLNFINSEVKVLDGKSSVYYFATTERDHFLSMLINVHSLSELSRFISSGNARVRDFLKQMKAVRVETQLPENRFLNLNKLDDYKN